MVKLGMLEKIYSGFDTGHKRHLKLLKVYTVVGKQKSLKESKMKGK